MEYKDKNLQKKQGSMQLQTQLNNQFNEFEEQQKKSKVLGIVLVSEVKSSSVVNDTNAKPKLKEWEIKEEVEDYIEVGKNKRSSWNSITFDNDDFVSGLMPA